MTCRNCHGTGEVVWEAGGRVSVDKCGCQAEQSSTPPAQLGMDSLPTSDGTAGVPICPQGDYMERMKKAQLESVKGMKPHVGEAASGVGGMCIGGKQSLESRIQWMESNFCEKHIEIPRISTGPCFICELEAATSKSSDAPHSASIEDCAKSPSPAGAAEWLKEKMDGKMYRDEDGELNCTIDTWKAARRLWDICIELHSDAEHIVAPIRQERDEAKRLLAHVMNEANHLTHIAKFSACPDCTKARMLTK